MPPKKSASTKVPKNWPPEILYLTAPAYSKTLSSHHLTSLKSPPKDLLLLPIPPSTPRGHSPLVKITPITTPSHPACGQSGLFAASDLKPGQFILQYLGIIHASPNPNSTTDSEEVRRDHDPHADSNYDLSLDRELGIGIDAHGMGNEARFINDYRGVAEKANAEFRECWDGRAGERGMGVWVLGEGKKVSGKGKGVRKGQEILVSYGRGFWGARKDIEEEGG